MCTRLFVVFGQQPGCRPPVTGTNRAWLWRRCHMASGNWGAMMEGTVGNAAAASQPALTMQFTSSTRKNLGAIRRRRMSRFRRAPRTEPKLSLRLQFTGCSSTAAVTTRTPRERSIRLEMLWRRLHVPVCGSAAWLDCGSTSSLRMRLRSFAIPSPAIGR